MHFCAGMTDPNEVESRLFATCLQNKYGNPAGYTEGSPIINSVLLKDSGKVKHILLFL